MNALLVVDLQNDFCPGGGLAVPDGDQIVPTVNKLMEQFERVIFTQDWHPKGHQSFASSHPGKEPFDTIHMDYGEQTLWPDHCIQGSNGARFHPELNHHRANVIIRKGFRPNIDSYSAFYENDRQSKTGLKGYLSERGIAHLFVCGLATDFCVKWTVLDGCREGFGITLIQDAVKGIDIENSVSKAMNEMQEAGAETIHSSQIQDNL